MGEVVCSTWRRSKWRLERLSAIAARAPSNAASQTGLYGEGVLAAAAAAWWLDASLQIAGLWTGERVYDKGGAMRWMTGE
jgi:hypothetical protein